MSSVHLHQTPSRRKMAAFLPHLNSSHLGEHIFACAKDDTTLDSSKTAYTLYLRGNSQKRYKAFSEAKILFNL